MTLWDLLDAGQLAVLVALSGLGLHRLWLLYASSLPVPRVAGARGEAPFVTVQLPLFDERAVAARVIAAAGDLRWPRDRFEVQVLDDSTDDTTAIAAEAVARLRDRGVQATLLHRSDRVGFKAGALVAGMSVARGEVIAIFDADFVPPPDCLERLVPRLGPGIGMVQARWGHLETGGWLERVQSVLLDGHFVLDHGGRFRAGHWFNFNGTAGVWRREAIEASGSWAHDTLTEDLDLSYRAQLAGWRFVYADDVVVPAELPPTMGAFKSQQHRWAKGTVQTARKLLGRVVRARVAPGVKLEAALHLGGNAGWPLSVALAVLLPWVGVAREAGGVTGVVAVDAALFGLAFLPALLSYGVAVWRADPDGRDRLVALPLVLAVGMGLGLAQTRAALEGLGGRVGEFVRTPKRGEGRPMYAARVHGVWALELGLAGWLLLGLVGALGRGDVASLPFLLLFAVGYGLVGGASAWDALYHQAARSPGDQVAAQSQPGSVQEAVTGSQVDRTR